MAKEKRRNFSVKFRSLFRTEKGKPPSQTSESFPTAPPHDALAVLNSGIPQDLEITTHLNPDPTSDQVEDTVSNVRATILAPQSPILRSPVLSITAYTSDECNDNKIDEDRERTHMRYQAAVLKLKEALDLRPELWSNMDPHKLVDVLENEDTSKLRAALQNRLNNVSEASTVWTKGKNCLNSCSS